MTLIPDMLLFERRNELVITPTRLFLKLLMDGSDPSLNPSFKVRLRPKARARKRRRRDSQCQRRLQKQQQLYTGPYHMQYTQQLENFLVRCRQRGFLSRTSGPNGFHAKLKKDGRKDFLVSILRTP